MANEVTKISDLINPQVMGDMISGKIPKKIVVAKIAKVDNKLEGQPGNTITVPKYGYIGDAEDVAEGVSVESVKLSTGSTQATIKKAVKSVDLTDEAVLSGYGDSVGEANNQLAKSIASKVDNDCLDALLGATFKYDGSDAVISYNQIVDAIDLFDEEVNTEKVMFINPKQLTKLRKDSNFVSADKYPGNVVMTGEIGMIANTHIVPSKKVSLNEAIPAVYELTEDVALDNTKTYYTKAGDIYTAVASPDVDDIATYYELKSSAIAEGTFYSCPIVKLEQDEETEDEVPALTIYLKRNVMVEDERDTKAGITSVTVNEHYVAVLSNDAKVVIAKLKK